MSKTTYRATLALLCLAASAPSSAATFCVDNAADLQNRLAMAAGNGQNNTIELVAGTYTPPTGSGFSYQQSGDSGLTIEGGFDAGCATRTRTPTSTVLDGGGSSVLPGPAAAWRSAT